MGSPNRSIKRSLPPERASRTAERPESTTRYCSSPARPRLTCRKKGRKTIPMIPKMSTMSTTATSARSPDRLLPWQTSRLRPPRSTCWRTGRREALGGSKGRSLGAGWLPYNKVRQRQLLSFVSATTS